MHGCGAAPTATNNNMRSPPFALQVIAAPAEPVEPLPTVEWWDARILAAKTYGGVIDGQPAQVRAGGRSWCWLVLSPFLALLIRIGPVL